VLADEGVYPACAGAGSGQRDPLGAVAAVTAVTAGTRPDYSPPRAVRPPTTHIATAPRQVWCWDVTYLPATV